VRLATTSVAGIKDEALRVAAFQTILAHLLATGAGPSQRQRTAPPRGAPSKEAKPVAPSRRGPKGRVQDLLDEGFFAEQKTINDLREELARRGHHHKLSELSPILLKLCQAKRLRRVKEPTEGSTKLVWKYSNW
jgi:hypothetical protein